MDVKWHRFLINPQSVMHFPVVFSVSQRNNSDCIYICVMAGKMGRFAAVTESESTWKLHACCRVFVQAESCRSCGTSVPSLRSLIRPSSRGLTEVCLKPTQNLVHPPPPHPCTQHFLFPFKQVTSPPSGSLSVSLSEHNELIYETQKSLLIHVCSSLY